MGAVNAYTEMMAERVGCKSLYLAGAGIAISSYGLPDLGITNVTDVLTDLRRVTDATVKMLHLCDEVRHSVIYRNTYQADLIVVS